MIAYRISSAAAADIVDMLAWSESNFGEVARHRYELLLATAMRDISEDPGRINSISRPELGQHVRSYHLRHGRQRARTEHGVVMRPRHFILYRFAHRDLIGVGRILHAMEVEEHLPRTFGDE